MTSRWMPAFVVWRMTDLGYFRLRTHSLADALFWARHLRTRWQETTWIEHSDAPAHDAGRVASQNATE